MYRMRMTEAQHRSLCTHLFPGDGLEAVALVLCGRRLAHERHALVVREVVPIPYQLCDRRPDRVTWPTSLIDDLVRKAYGKGAAIVKVHSHVADFRKFSAVDDSSDRDIFAAITSLLDDGLPHASMIMLPDGELFGRVVGADGVPMDAIDAITAVGDGIRMWSEARSRSAGSFAVRHAQAFGKGTTARLGTLSAAVVGCSGTGSIIVEQLARLGIGRLVLVDPDVVEDKNLNRILNSGKEDSYLHRPKVHVLASAVAHMGLGQEVVPLQMDLHTREAVEQVAGCDVIFGGMDGVEGRHLLNRIATFYTLPYFDVGVHLKADGVGGIEQISGAVHYLQPGRSSLLSRGVYNMERVDAEAMRRTDPGMYKRLVGEGYLRGIDEDRPAVITINMFFASLVVNDFLARIHPYRNAHNSSFAYVGASLSEMQFYLEGETAPCELLARHVGKGDVTPLLDRPSLS